MCRKFDCLVAGAQAAAILSLKLSGCDLDESLELELSKFSSLQHIDLSNNKTSKVLTFLKNPPGRGSHVICCVVFY